MQTTDWPRSISRRMSRGPMKPVPPITSIDMLSLLVGRPPTSSGRQPVVGGAVVPEDLALALVRDRQLEERLDRARELRVTVREVGGEDDPAVADRVDDVLQQRVGAELLADVAELGARPLVEAQRDLELLELGPQRLVVRIVPVAPVHLVRPQEQAPEAELSHAAAGLGHRILDGERRDHA